MYKRKTVDIWELHGDYGQGMEYLTGNYTRKETEQDRKDYIKNDNQLVGLKIVKKREKIT